MDYGNTQISRLAVKSAGPQTVEAGRDTEVGEGLMLTASQAKAKIVQPEVALKARIHLVVGTGIVTVFGLVVVVVIAFRHLPPNSARFGYATEGARTRS